jgi:ABC-type multidrug transport system ATPase subunit
VHAHRPLAIPPGHGVDPVAELTTVTPLLELQEVTRRVDGMTLLEAVSFQVRPGERLALLGASGSGKSTLLRLLVRLDDPESGDLRFQGAPLVAQDPLVLRRQVRLVPQHAVALPGTVADNLQVAARLAQATLGPAEQEALLDRVGLAPELRDRSAERLSGGELQRLALARALISDPLVLALDEPTAHLDLPAARQLMGAASGVSTLLVATHDLAVVRDRASRVLVLEKGHLVEEGEAQHFLAGPTSREGRRLLAGSG